MYKIGTHTHTHTLSTHLRAGTLDLQLQQPSSTQANVQEKWSSEFFLFLLLSVLLSASYMHNIHFLQYTKTSLLRFTNQTSA